jgi:hypothetical protein
LLAGRLVKLPPLLAGFLRFLLIGIGATAVLSAVVNLMATIELMEPSDEAVMGMSRNALIASYVIQISVGLTMLYFGFRKRKR